VRQDHRDGSRRAAGLPYLKQTVNEECKPWTRGQKAEVDSLLAEGGARASS
jgi:hypothetical protein